MLKQLILHIKIDKDFVKQLFVKRSQTFFFTPDFMQIAYLFVHAN
jgi:hypothetical protein